MKIKLVHQTERRSNLTKSAEAFAEALKSLLPYPLEIVDEIDDGFDGYYIVIFDYKYEMELTKPKNENLFLLGAINPEINKILRKYQPAGLIQWRLFLNYTTAIYGLDEVWAANNIEFSKDWFGTEDYTCVIPIKSDHTYKSTAKAVLSYLEMYDKWRKNK